MEEENNEELPFVPNCPCDDTGMCDGTTCPQYWTVCNSTQKCNVCGCKDTGLCEFTDCKSKEETI